jgi:transposase
MDTLAEILALPASLELINERLAPDSKTLVFTIAPTSPRAPCPLCQTPSGKIHSYYDRTVADLNWGIYRVSWHLRARKFFCSEGTCPRKVFTERIEGTIEPYARKTRRLTEKLGRIGLALGGKAGEKLSGYLDLPTDRQTLLSYVKRMPTPSPGQIRVLGVDD